MKVYILIGEWDYSSSTVLGVYENEELAEEQKIKHEEKADYDSYEVEEHEVLKWKEIVI